MTVYVFNDDVRSTLLLSVDDSATTINVTNPVGIYNDPPNPGSGEIATVKIVDRIDNPTRKEVITYTGRTSITGGYSLTGVARGVGGTTAALWEAGCHIVGLISSDLLSSPMTITGTTVIETSLHRVDIAEITTNSVADYFLNDGYAIAEFRTLLIKLQITSGIDYQFTTYTLIHNDVTPYLEQAGANDDSGNLTTLDADINVSGNGLLRIIVRPVNAVTTYKAVIEAFKK